MVLDGELTFFSESKGDKITFVANKREIVKIGSDLVCDVRIVGADDVHMTIEMDSTGKVSVRKIQRRKRKKNSVTDTNKSRHTCI